MKLQCLPAGGLAEFRFSHGLCELSSSVGALQDYLTAPMPFLVGMCVTSLLGLDLEGVVVVDLDMASVSVGAAGYGIGKGHGTAELLPWAGCAPFVFLHPINLRRLTCVRSKLWVCSPVASSACASSVVSCRSETGVGFRLRGFRV